jgi:hypothetical protein
MTTEEKVKKALQEFMPASDQYSDEELRRMYRDLKAFLHAVAVAIVEMDE